jgi:putative membrane protein
MLRRSIISTQPTGRKINMTTHNAFKIAAAITLSGGICMWQIPAQAEVSGADKEFLKKASESNFAEIQAGEMAQKKGTSSQVKMMGEHIVKDHKKAEEELQKLAKTKGVEIEEDTTMGKQTEAASLSKAEGEKFDKEFLEHQVKDHKAAIALFETEAKKGSDPEVKAWAEKTLPVLQSHLAMAQGGEGGGKKAGEAGKKEKADAH